MSRVRGNFVDSQARDIPWPSEGGEGADDEGEDMGRFDSDDDDDRAELAKLLESAAGRGGGEAADLIAQRDENYEQFMKSGGADRLLAIERKRGK